MIDVRLAGEALDATGTTIDSNGNRLSEGNGVDDFVWTFQTLPTTTPQILQITPTSAATAVLESTDNLGAGQWQAVAVDPVLEDGSYSVTVPAGDGVRFFRLKYQP